MWQESIVEAALREEREGAHYLKRGYGHKFDAEGNLTGGIVDGREPTSVQFIGRTIAAFIVNQVPPDARATARRVRFAATSFMEGSRRICSGRCDRPQVSGVGDPDNPQHLSQPQNYCWVRPRNLPEMTQEARGECCIGKRHFDCTGFVSWCFWKALGAEFPRHLATSTVSQWKAWARQRLPMSGPFLPGDLLFDQGERHIGVVVSATEVAHSAGYRWGVRRTPISGQIYGDRGGRWHSAGRPPIRSPAPAGGSAP